LGRITDEIGRCIAKNGGLTRSSGTIKIQFLVRARGRAEGVEVLSSQGVSAEASTCVRQLLKNRTVGHPTSDPVGVTVVLTFKPALK
jgi:outer membrane biosynthesis protein TonB